MSTNEQKRVPRTQTSKLSHEWAGYAPLETWSNINSHFFFRRNYHMCRRICVEYQVLVPLLILIHSYTYPDVGLTPRVRALYDHVL
jgi:hypothetical protein